MKGYEGSYRISSSNASDLTVFSGATTLRIREGELVYVPKRGEREVRKAIRVVAIEDDGALVVELDHLGDFKPSDPPGAEAQAVGAGSQGWSRHARLSRTASSVSLVTGFPQEPPGKWSAERLELSPEPSPR